jgi:hypothetical protein
VIAPLPLLLSTLVSATPLPPCELPSVSGPAAYAAYAAAQPAARFDSTLLALFDSGRPFDQFLAETKARREGWLKHSEAAAADATLVERARAVGGTWKFLVVAIDACNDSMHSVPYLARLVSEVPGLDLRIVLPEQGQWVQEAHRTLDGRVATPTFVLLDAEGSEAGCIVELPSELRNWTHALRSSGRTDSLQAGKREFYERDKGRGITTEAVELLEAAAAGSRICHSGNAR